MFFSTIVLSLGGGFPLTSILLVGKRGFFGGTSAPGWNVRCRLQGPSSGGI